MHIHRDRKTWVLTAGAVMLIALTALLVWDRTRPEPWAPLYGPAEGQTITDQTATYVAVDGQKCNSDPLAVWIRGTIYAQQMSPIGASILIGTGEGVRLPGCTLLSFQNPYPTEMVAATESLKGSVVWRFYGEDVPVGYCRSTKSEVPEGKKATRLSTFLPQAEGPAEERVYYCWERSAGATWTWATENFTLPYEGP